MFKLGVETVNAAFDEPGPELARILRAVADLIEQHVDRHPRFDGKVRDVNGNTVGSFRYLAD